MEVSPYDHEFWYGDPNKVAKMQGDDFKKEFYNNLKSLLVAHNVLNSSFNLATFKKY
jgi:predicted nucleotidyltransferase